MRELLTRRDVLRQGWKVGMAAIGVAALWTTWDVLRPPRPAGAGAVVKSLRVDEVPDAEAVAVQAARAYLTRVGEEIVALSEKCPHLRCRVDWCESSGQFECPCHGSTFNRLGEHRSGPAASGMERFAIEVVEGTVHIDTGAKIDGPALGAETLDEPVRGPSCAEEA